MFIGHVVNEAGFPLFIHAKPHLFSMENSVFIVILAKAADVYCLLLADFTFTLSEPVCSYSLCDSQPISGTEVSFYPAPRQSINCHQSRCPVRCTTISISSSHRVVVVID